MTAPAPAPAPLLSGGLSDEQASLLSDSPRELALVPDADAPPAAGGDHALDVHDFRQDLDADLVEELTEAGLPLGGEDSLDQAARDAMASRCLRRAALHDVAIARHQRARDLELSIITAHYDALIGREQKARGAAIQQAEILGQISAERKGFGKKKSGTTPWGTYGVRHHEATVELVDRDQLLAWCREHRKDLVNIVAKLPLVDAAQYFTPTELATMKADVQWSTLKGELQPTGELPPGVKPVKAGITPFAKVQPAADASSLEVLP